MSAYSNSVFRPFILSSSFYLHILATNSRHICSASNISLLQIHFLFKFPGNLMTQRTRNEANSPKNSPHLLYSIIPMPCNKYDVSMYRMSSRRGFIGDNIAICGKKGRFCHVNSMEMCPFSVHSAYKVRHL